MKEVRLTYAVGSELCERVIRKPEYMVITTDYQGKQTADFVESLEDIDLIGPSEAFWSEIEMDCYELDEKTGKYVPMTSWIEMRMKEKGE